MVVISIINRETSEKTQIEVEIGLLNASGLLKSLIEEYEEIPIFIPIVVDPKNFIYSSEYFEIFLPYIKKKNSNNDRLDVSEIESRQPKYTLGSLLVYLEIANFMEDESMLEIVTEIIAKSLKKHIKMSNNIEIIKEFNSIPMELNDMIAKRLSINSIEYLVKKYPNKPWDWGKSGLSWNEAITIKFVGKNIDKPWNWTFLSTNKEITMKFLEKCIDKPWDWYALLMNNVVTIEFLEKYRDEKWDWETSDLNKSAIIEKYTGNGLLANSKDRFNYIPVEMMMMMNMYPNKKRLSGCQRQPKEERLALMEELVHEDSNWGDWGLSWNEAITIEFVEKYIDKPWSWDVISSFEEITMEFVEKYIDKDW